jgi:hypothetical protein
MALMNILANKLYDQKEPRLSPDSEKFVLLVGVRGNSSGNARIGFGRGAAAAATQLRTIK